MIRELSRHSWKASAWTAFGWVVGLLAFGYGLPIGLHLIIEALKEAF